MEFAVGALIVAVIALATVPIILYQTFNAQKAALESNLSTAMTMLVAGEYMNSNLPTQFPAGRDTMIPGVGTFNPEETIYVVSTGALLQNGAVVPDTLCVQGETQGGAELHYTLENGVQEGACPAPKAFVLGAYYPVIAGHYVGAFDLDQDGTEDYALFAYRHNPSVATIEAHPATVPFGTDGTFNRNSSERDGFANTVVLCQSDDAKMALLLCEHAGGALKDADGAIPSDWYLASKEEAHQVYRVFGDQAGAGYAESGFTPPHGPRGTDTRVLDTSAFPTYATSTQSEPGKLWVQQVGGATAGKQSMMSADTPAYRVLPLRRLELPTSSVD